MSAEMHVSAESGHDDRVAKATGKPVEAWPTRFVEVLEVQGIPKK